MSRAPSAAPAAVAAMHARGDRTAALLTPLRVIDGGGQGEG